MQEQDALSALKDGMAVDLLFIFPLVLDTCKFYFILFSLGLMPLGFQCFI